ncbi:hypothetical protein [Lacinutrix jangbogonensis]|uniref:hypothetical protein n=1 Tax=Lacinutrix jangbogonensis TaxID=1469557 RepID=UPI00053EE7B4|nr:hypothetical protein [Lacinutrix jangbogonensis]
MKTQILQHMQKGQKHVIKLILLFLFLSVNCCKAKMDKNEYYFLDKMIQLTKQANDSVYHLSRRNGTTGSLTNYYKFRFNNRSFYTTFTYDSITGQDGIDTLELEQNRIKWKAKYRILDNAFSREDLDKVIARKGDATKWDSTNIIFNNKKLPLIKWNNGYYSKNFISKPYYNEKKTHAFIVSSHKIKTARTARIYVFKKENEEWVVIDTIENVGW